MEEKWKRFLCEKEINKYMIIYDLWIIFVGRI